MRRFILAAFLTLALSCFALDIKLRSGRVLTEATVDGLDSTGRVRISYVFKTPTSSAPGMGAFSQDDLTVDSQKQIAVLLGQSSNQWVTTFQADKISPKTYVVSTSPLDAEELAVRTRLTAETLSFLAEPLRSSVATKIVIKVTSEFGEAPLTPPERKRIDSAIRGKHPESYTLPTGGKEYLEWCAKCMLFQEQIVDSVRVLMAELAAEKSKRRSESQPNWNQQAEIDRISNELKSQELRQSGLRDELENVKRKASDSGRELDDLKRKTRTF